MHEQNRLNSLFPKLLFTARLFFGAILVYASVDKILHPVQFALAVENYRLIGAEASRWVAIWLPYLELLTGLLLISGIWSDVATVTTTVLMAIFFVAVFQAYFRGLDINCGCFSVDGETNLGIRKVMENLALLIGSLGLVFLQRHRATLLPSRS